MKRKKLWLGLGGISAFVLTFTSVGSQLANKYESLINNTLNAKTFEKVTVDGASTNTQYFASEFGELNEANQKKLVEAGFEQNINEMKEGAVLMKNKNGALPLKSEERRVSLFGHAQVQPLLYGVSAGSRPNAGYAPELKEALEKEGFQVNETLYNALKNSGTCRGMAMPWGYLTMGSAAKSEDPISVYTDEVKASWKSDYQDAAIYMIARQGHESADMLVHDKSEGQYEDRSSMALIPEEIQILQMLKEEKAAGRLKKIIVLLNTASQLEVNWLDEYDVDSCMFIGCVGGQGMRGVASIIKGDTNPSGKLVDTYAVSSTSAPAVVNSIDNTPAYLNVDEIDGKLNVDKNSDGTLEDENASHMSFQAEGIYVGYKYYETRYEDTVLGNGNASDKVGATGNASSWKYQDEISYPFGHGLSYTTFKQELVKTTYDKSSDEYKLDVKVTNEGDVAGKSVVQVYAQTPYEEYEKANKVEKSAIQLVGFDKTKLLESKASETVTVSVPRYFLASYDYTNLKGYYLSQGDYYLSIGENAHDALNNVLGAKGKTSMVDYEGNAVTGDSSKTYRFTLGQIDFTSYQRSSADSDIIVTNHFDDCDLNYWVKDAEKYLSRSNWRDTYPTKATSVEATEEMIKILGGDTYVKPKDAPSVAEVTKDLGKNAGIQFVSMKDVDYDNDEAWDAYLNQMTLDELMSTLECSSGRNAVVSVSLPQTSVGDGVDGGMGHYPFAYEDTTGKYGSGKYGAGEMYSTRYASKTILTGTFNKDLIKRRGELEGEDGLWCEQVEIWNGGFDLHRTPFNGRAYEYCSEDANLTYFVGAIEVPAMEAKGTLAGVKHFTGNDQEFERHGVTLFFNEQAFREGSLRAFEGALKEGKATSLMQSFNRLGLEWASAKSALNIDVLRKEWKFEGHVETDGTDNALTGFMSHYATTLTAGSDTYCLNSKASIPLLKKQIEETDDGNLVYAVKDAAKHFHYAMSRSNAINGLDSSTKLVPITPAWKVALNATIATSAVLTAGFIALAIVNQVRKEKEEK